MPADEELFTLTVLPELESFTEPVVPDRVLPEVPELLLVLLPEPVVPEVLLPVVEEPEVPEFMVLPDVDPDVPEVLPVPVVEPDPVPDGVVETVVPELPVAGVVVPDEPVPVSFIPEGFVLPEPVATESVLVPLVPCDPDPELV